MKRFCWLFFLLPFFSVTALCSNLFADAIQLQNTINLAAGTWSGSGAVDFDSNAFCVSSYTGDSTGSYSEQFRVRVYNSTSGSSGQFRLLNGVNSLPLTLVYTDLYNSGVETLVENTWTSTAKNGFDNCDSYNGTITMSILEASLLAVPAGSYQETMAIGFEQIENGSEAYNSTFIASITVPDLVRISNLNDIALGVWSGAGDLSGSDDVCVYRNSSGGYAVTFTGDGGSAGGTGFFLTNNSNNLPYSVVYNDGSGDITVTAGTALTGRSGHHQTSATCGSGTNATITVTTLESVMVATPVDSYSGTLTMLVAPE